MSIGARKEYLRAIWGRYRKARRKEKRLILDELTQVTGLNRKYAIWRLGQPLEFMISERRSGAPRQYDRAALLPHVRELWLAMEQIGSKRMKAAFSIWLPFYQVPEFTDEMRQALLKMSASTLERILHELRQQLRPHGLSTTRPGYLLKSRIPIQTKNFTIAGPGHLEGDTVAHCGDNASGEFVHTVTYTDIHSTWTELRAAPNRSAHEVLKATQDVEMELPFDVLSADYDNGGEFINYDMEAYWKDKRRGIAVAYLRSRPYKKNDQCYVEQKNWTHVRQLFGYDRIVGRELCRDMNRIYKEIWCPLHNYFLPAQKLLRKTRVGAKIVKQYDQPKTPYQRLLESADLAQEKKAALSLKYESLNPFELRLRLEQELKNFFSRLRISQSASRAA